MMPEGDPKEEVPMVVGLGSIASNIARAVGPVVAGVVIVVGGPGPVFLINAATVLGVFIVLWRWRREPHPATLPAERLASAVRAGIRDVRYTPALRTAIGRTRAFLLVRRPLWALLV